MSRSSESLKEALRLLPELREEFWNNLKVPGESRELNQELERAGRIGDFIEFAQLLCYDALNRDESCGAHFRVEHQTEEGEAVRNDDDFSYVSVWEFQGDDKQPINHREELEFMEVQMTTRS